MLERPLSSSPWLCSTTKLFGEGVSRLRRCSGMERSGKASRWASRGGFSSEIWNGCGTAIGVARGTWLTGLASRTDGGRRTTEDESLEGGRDRDELGGAAERSTEENAGRWASKERREMR